MTLSISPIGLLIYLLPYPLYKSYCTSNGSPLIPPMEVLLDLQWKSSCISNGSPLAPPMGVLSGQ